MVSFVFVVSMPLLFSIKPNTRTQITERAPLCVQNDFFLFFPFSFFYSSAHPISNGNDKSVFFRCCLVCILCNVLIMDQLEGITLAFSPKTITTTTARAAGGGGGEKKHREQCIALPFSILINCIIFLLNFALAGNHFLVLQLLFVCRSLEIQSTTFKVTRPPTRPSPKVTLLLYFYQSILKTLFITFSHGIFIFSSSSSFIWNCNLFERKKRKLKIVRCFNENSRQRKCSTMFFNYSNVLSKQTNLFFHIFREFPFSSLPFAILYSSVSSLFDVSFFFWYSFRFFSTIWIACNESATNNF